MKIGGADLDAFPYMPGSHSDGAMVQLRLSMGVLFAKTVDVKPEVARELAAQLLGAANAAEGKQ